MNSCMLSPNIGGKETIAEALHELLRGDFPMVGMRFKALRTAEDWSLPDRLLRRISVHRGAAQWPHFLRYSSASSARPG